MYVLIVLLLSLLFVAKISMSMKSATLFMLSGPLHCFEQTHNKFRYRLYVSVADGSCFARLAGMYGGVSISFLVLTMGEPVGLFGRIKPLISVQEFYWAP